MSESKLVMISRAELYTLLWQNAAYKVASAYGISHESLVKICNQHLIPRPPRAYWIMVAKGRFVDRPPLQQVGNEVDQIIQIIPDEKLKPTTPLPPLKSGPLPTITKPIEVGVPDTLLSPLPLVKRTISCLRAGSPGDDRLIRLNNYKGCLDVAVSRQQISRAMQFLDIFFKTAQSRGMTVGVEIQNGKEVTLLTVGTSDIQFRMWEMCSGLGRQRRARGDLFLMLDGGGAKRRDWSDRDDKPLDKQIVKIVDAAERMGERVRLWEQEWEERDREWAEEKRQQVEAAAIQAKQVMLKSQLKEQIERWQQAELVRTYIVAVKAKTGEVEPNSELGEWIAWASEHAASLDPLTGPIEELPQRCRKPV